MYAQNAAAYTSYLTLPADNFCLTAASITFWINVVTPVPFNTIARIIDFSDAPNKSNGIALYIKPATSVNNAAVGFEVKSSGSAQNLNDPNVGFAPQTWTHVAVAFSFTGSAITVSIYYNGVVAYTTSLPISLPSLCLLMTTNFIGKSTSPTFNDVNLDAYLNDIKLFNFSLTATQVLAQYTAEKCKIYLLYCF